ncbi:MAG: hypothetical protein ACXAAK_14245, partial [Candidatus Thorarchaeota archaeon]
QGLAILVAEYRRLDEEKQDIFRCVWCGTTTSDTWISYRGSEVYLCSKRCHRAKTSRDTASSCLCRMGAILSIIIAGFVSITFQLQSGVGFALWLLTLALISVAIFVVFPKRPRSRDF